MSADQMSSVIFNILSCFCCGFHHWSLVPKC